jgi:predicted component of type VI protein secretion system
MEGSRMNASLLLLKKGGDYKAFPLASSVTVIGRRHDCDLRIPLPVVSRRHCQLSQNGDSLVLRDLGSRGGTFINDKRADKEKEIPLKAGDYLRIGPLTFLCRINGKPEKITPPKKATPQTPKPPPKPQKAAARPADTDDDLSDLDVSDSVVNLDESDSDLEDLRNA